MYMIVHRDDTVRIPPDMLSYDMDTIIDELTHTNFEGKMNHEGQMTIQTMNVDRKGDGRIAHGDAGVYQNVSFDAIVFKPMMYEVVMGTVCEVLKYGVFVRIGPLDGLLHISQVMDDHIDVDLANERLVGKETKRDIKVGDRVRVRIVTVSINEKNPRESKIGLTMRQPGLGKLDWIEEDKKKDSEEEETPAKKSKKRSKK